LSLYILYCSIIHYSIDIYPLSLHDALPIFPRSKMKEEQELIQMVTKATAETSFIKFNFNRIGDFWSYAVKHECTLLVTTKNYQRSEEHTSELQSRENLVCRLLLEKKNEMIK